MFICLWILFWNLTNDRTETEQFQGNINKLITGGPVYKPRHYYLPELSRVAQQECHDVPFCTFDKCQTVYVNTLPAD